MKKNFKENLVEFFKELGAGFILACIAVVLSLIGWLVLTFLPDKISAIFPVEAFLLIGFFTLLLLLYIVSKIIEAIGKMKEKKPKSKTMITQEEPASPNGN